MLWTILNEDTIMEGIDKINNAEEYIYQQRRILGYPSENGKICIVRLISSNPSDFLDPRFTPGNLVNAKKM